MLTRRYTLVSSDKQFFTALPNKLHWLGDSNMNTMAQVAANLAMTGNPTLGESILRSLHLGWREREREYFD